jgi:CheY-like chemotaxis protein
MGASFHLRGRTVLVVEDDSISRAITGLQLQALGATVLAASNGAEALDMAKEAKPDLVICDLMMPKMDGFAFMQHLRADPSLSRVRVLALSALESPPDLFRTWKAGFVAHLVKPIQTEALHDQLTHILADHDPS